MRFQPGQSGNPAGRPPGSLNKKTLALEALFMEAAEETVKNVIERAKEGHPAAMRLVMTRALPTGRNRPIAINLPTIEEPDDARDALAVVTAALADGELTIAEASALINLIDRMLRLAERVRKIEAMRRAAEAAAEAEGEDAVAAQAPAPTFAAALASALAAAVAAKTTDEALHSPVNDESCQRGASAEGGGSERGPDEIAPDKAGSPADALYFPVNKAA